MKVQLSRLKPSIDIFERAAAVAIILFSSHRFGVSIAFPAVLLRATLGAKAAHSAVTQKKRLGQALVDPLKKLYRSNIFFRTRSNSALA